MKTILQKSFAQSSIAIILLLSNSYSTAQIQVDADGVGAYGIAHLTKVGNKMFFYGTNETNSNNLDLFMHDGTTSTFVKHLASFTQNPGINTTKIIHDGYGKAYFHFNSNGGAMPDGLVVSDGTEAGTTNIFSCSQPGWYSNCNGKVFFSTKLGTSSDVELFVSDGTAVGTSLVKDIYPGSTGSDPRAGVEFKNKFWFTAKSSTLSGYHLYLSDGTDTGTSMFVYPAQLKGSITDLYVHNGFLYFKGSKTNGSTSALWRTDGTTSGTEIIFEGSTTVGAFGIINSLDNTLLGFSTNTSVFPYIYSLYSIDAISLDTSLIKSNILITSGQAGDGWLLNNKMVFLAKTTDVGDEPWITDGTPSGTFMLADITSGSSNTTIYRNAGYANNKLFLNVRQEGIWSTDGTTLGTTATGVENDNNFFNSFLSLDNEIYFIKDSQGKQMKLFKLGTAASSISSNKLNDLISVYPNPSAGIFFIQSQDLEETNYSVRNILGEKVFESKATTNNISINLTNQPKGFYFITFEKGNNVTTKKILIQ